MGVQRTDCLDWEVFLFVGALGSVEVGVPKVVVEPEVQLAQKALVHPLHGEGKHAGIARVYGREEPQVLGDGSGPGAGDGRQHVEPAGPIVIKGGRLLVHRVDAAGLAEAPPNMLGPLFAQAFEVSLLPGVTHPGGDANVIVAFLGNVRPFPKCAALIEQLQVEQPPGTTPVDFAVVRVTGVFHGQ